MEILFVLVAISLFMSLMALGAFLWANINKQFEDLQRPAEEIILNDDGI